MMSPMPASRTIGALLDELAVRHGAREALVGDGRRFTYASLREEVRAFAKGLRALGVRKGDKVAILMGNKPEWIIADLAICLLGGVMVAVNTWVTSRELNHIIAHSDSAMLIARTRRGWQGARPRQNSQLWPIEGQRQCGLRLVTK